MATTPDPNSSTLEDEDVNFGVEIKFSSIRPDRMKAYSDAVWSIIATIMIVPTMHQHITEEIKTKHSLSEIIQGMLPQIFLYFLAFLIICSTWACHVWTFQTMKKVTDFSIFFNLIVLMAATFIPYFYSLMSKYKTWQTIVVYCSLQITIGILQTIIVFHAFSYPELLPEKVYEQPEDQRRQARWKILSHILVQPCFALLAICISFASARAAIICLAMSLVYPWVQSLIVCLLARSPKCAKIIQRKNRQLEETVLLTERIKKSRIEAFSDGVFAITGTLLILDITEKYLPTKKKLDAVYGGQVINALNYNWGVFVSYIVTFLIIGLIWFTQLTLYKNLFKVSRLMLFVNNWILACVGMIPLAFTFILHFHTASFVRAGMQFGCVALFLSGFFTTVLYCIALAIDRCNRYGERKEIWLCRAVQPGGEDFAVMMFQLLASPIGSVIVFGLTYLKSEYVAVYVGTAVILLYAVTLLLWKTMKATCCKNTDEEDEKKGYSLVASSAEYFLREVGEGED